MVTIKEEAESHWCNNYGNLPPVELRKFQKTWQSNRIYNNEHYKSTRGTRRSAIPTGLSQPNLLKNPLSFSVGSTNSFL